MKQFTSPGESGSRRTAQRPTGAAPHALTAYSDVDFAVGPRPPQAVRVESPEPLGAVYHDLVDLQPQPAQTRPAIFAALGDPLPAPDPETGVRHYLPYAYLDTEDGTTVMGARDPLTLQWRETSPELLLSRGPALQRVAQTNTWRSDSSGGSSASSTSVSQSSSASSLAQSPSFSSLAPMMNNVTLATATRIDPVWNIDLYKLPVGAAPAPTLSFPEKKSIMIGADHYVMDTYYGDTSTKAPYRKTDSKLYSVDSNGELSESGHIEPNGVFKINGKGSYVQFGTGFCEVLFDNATQRWKVVGASTSARPDIYIEMGHAPDKWVPALAVDRVPELFQSARDIKTNTTRTGPVDLIDHPVDKQVYAYMQTYLRQIIGCCEPSILGAPVQQKGKLIDEYIWRHGYPYDCLSSIVDAVKTQQPLPPGLPAFDAFQGLATVTCSKSGGFNVAGIYNELHLRYPDRERSAAERLLLTAWKARKDARQTREQGALNEQMYEARLTQDGYVRLPGGTYGGGQNGFDLVFKGPAGNIYILEVKHVGSAQNRPGTVMLGSITAAYQMTNTWIARVLSVSDTHSDAYKHIVSASNKGQLFKLLGTTTPDGTLILFKIDMSPVDF